MKNHSTKYFSALIGIIIATTALLGIVLIANAAPQHWINVSATACQKSGNVEVKYIATSWATGDDGTNTDVSFQYQVLRSDGTASDYITVTSSDDGSNFSLSSDNNYTIAGTLYLGAETD